MISRVLFKSSHTKSQLTELTWTSQCIRQRPH